MRAATSTPRTRRAAMAGALCTLLAAAAFAASVPSGQVAVSERPDQFTGNLINALGTARHTHPFTLEIDHYTTQAELQQIVHTLAAKGQYNLRDLLWKTTAGNFSVAGQLGYPVAAVLATDTPQGRFIRVLVDRPVHGFEVLADTHTSHYPFTVIELRIDNQGQGEGLFIGAAKLMVQHGELKFESYGPQPLHLLNVREG
jgi:hypothetical protein